MLYSILGAAAILSAFIGNGLIPSFAQGNTSDVGNATMEITITHPNGTEVLSVESAISDCGHIKLGGPGRECLLD